MYNVILTGCLINQQKAFNIYGKTYFPREIYYKVDAERLLNKLQQIRIEAEIVKTQPRRKNVNYK